MTTFFLRLGEQIRRLGSIDGPFWRFKLRRAVHKETRTADELYAAATALFEKGDFSGADFNFRLFLYKADLKELIEDENTNGCPSSAYYADFAPAFCKFLEAQANAWAQGVTPPPSFLGRREEPADPAVARRYSVLFVLPRYIHNSDRFVEYDLWDHFYETAINAGVRADRFYADRIDYPILNLDPDAAAEDLRKLREHIDKTRPDVVLFDANFIGDDVSLNAAYLGEIKASYGTKLIGFIGDAWGIVWVPVADYWGAVADLIVHVAPGGAVETNSVFHEKLVCTPYPCNDRNFFREEIYETDISFFGTAASFLRPFWITSATMIAQRLKLRSNLRAHNRTSENPDIAQYAKIMRRSRMVLNCSTRYKKFKMITGRVWQSMSSGVVLLEEENAMTRQFFVPFVHYVPYENIRQLGHMIRFFKENTDWADRIGRTAAEFSRQHYSASLVWARILSRL